MESAFFIFWRNYFPNPFMCKTVMDKICNEFLLLSNFINMLLLHCMEMFCVVFSRKRVELKNKATY